MVVKAAGLCQVICWAVVADTVTKEGGWNPCWFPEIISFSALQKCIGLQVQAMTAVWNVTSASTQLLRAQTFRTSNKKKKKNKNSAGWWLREFWCMFSLPPPRCVIYVDDVTSSFALCARSHIVMFPGQMPRLISDLWTKLRQKIKTECTELYTHHMSLLFTSFHHPFLHFILVNNFW